MLRLSRFPRGEGTQGLVRAGQEPVLVALCAGTGEDPGPAEETEGEALTGGEEVRGGHEHCPRRPSFPL